MQKTAIGSAAIIGLIVIGFWVWKHPVAAPQGGAGIDLSGAFSNAATQEASSTATVPVSAFSHPYSDKSYGLSFSYPDGYGVKSTPNADGSGNTILIQNDATKKGVQVLITPFDDTDTTLTEARIKQDIPDMKVTDAQPVTIGENGKGLAFISDNGAFDGNSREVWFVYRGNLYQISTYASYDEFIKALLATWKFQ